MDEKTNSRGFGLSVIGVVGIIGLLALMAMIFLMYGSSVGLDKVL